MRWPAPRHARASCARSRRTSLVALQVRRLSVAGQLQLLVHFALEALDDGVGLRGGLELDAARELIREHFERNLGLATLAWVVQLRLEPDLVVLENLEVLTRSERLAGVVLVRERLRKRWRLRSWRRRHGLGRLRHRLLASRPQRNLRPECWPWVARHHAIELWHAGLGDQQVVIGVQLRDHVKLVLEPIALNRCHAHLLGHLLAAAVLLEHVLGLRAHRDNEVRRAAQERLYERVMLRCDVAPRREAVAAGALRSAVYLLEGAILTHPRVRERVDDHHVVALPARKLERFDVACRREALKLERVVLAEAVSILRCAAVLGIDDGDSLAQAARDAERRERLATAGRADHRHP